MLFFEMLFRGFAGNRINRILEIIILFLVALNFFNKAIFSLCVFHDFFTESIIFEIGIAGLIGSLQLIAETFQDRFFVSNDCSIVRLDGHLVYKVFHVVVGLLCRRVVYHPKVHADAIGIRDRSYGFSGKFSFHFFSDVLPGVIKGAFLHFGVLQGLQAKVGKVFVIVVNLVFESPDCCLGISDNIFSALFFCGLKPLFLIIQFCHILVAV